MVQDKIKIDINHSTVELRQDGIVEIVFKDSSLIDINECKELISTYEKILKKKKYPLLHIISNHVQVTSKARQFGASIEGLRFSSAEAYIINSLAHKLLANFYLKMDKPSVPTHFFSKKEDAIKWLKQFL